MLDLGSCKGGIGGGKLCVWKDLPTLPGKRINAAAAVHGACPPLCLGPSGQLGQLHPSLRPNLETVNDQ